MMLFLVVVVERPVTVQYGTNKLVGLDRKSIVSEAYSSAECSEKFGRIPELWDGNAAVRIVETIKARVVEAAIKKPRKQVVIKRGKG